jgi:hypothetical protein
VPHVVDDGFGVSVQLLVPLHVFVMHDVDVQETVIPSHTPPEQTSPYVHRLPSSHAVLTRHAHVPPVFVQVYVVPPQLRVWHDVAALHVVDVPALHVPFARSAPQPVQLRPVVTVVALQMSAQLPAAVLQPATSSHSAVQHWFSAPTSQRSSVVVHEQLAHVSSVPLQYRVHVPG